MRENSITDDLKVKEKNKIGELGVNDYFRKFCVTKEDFYTQVNRLINFKLESTK